MWMICGFFSILFCILGWWLAVKRHPMVAWACLGSLALVSLCLLGTYQLVLTWVNRQDWSALMDVVPTAFQMLTGYVALLLLANAGAIGVWKRKK